MRFALLLLALAACKPSISPLSEEKNKELAKAIAALEEAPRNIRARASCEAVVEIESERLPASLVQAFDAMANGDAEVRTQMVTKGIASMPKELDALCGKDSTAFLSALGKVAPEERAAQVRSRCSLESFGPVGDNNLLESLMAHVALVHLKQNGGFSAKEKKLLSFVAQGSEPLY